jgi:hemoglobin
VKTWKTGPNRGAIGRQQSATTLVVMENTPDSTKTTTIYDAIGGPAAVGAAVTQFYERVLADPGLAPFFAGTDMTRLQSHQRAFIAAALGGPQLYAGRSMSAAHAGREIPDTAFDAVVGHLGATLIDLGVPAETVGVIASRLAPLRGEIVCA